MCLEGLQNTSTWEQALSSGDEATGRGRKMDVLHQIGADWWLLETQLRKGIKNNNPAETAAQHIHCCVQFIAQAGGSCGFGIINKEERSISKLGVTSSTFLEGSLSDEESGEGNFQNPCHPLGQISQQLWHPAPSPRGISCQCLHAGICSWPHIISQRDPTCPVSEISEVLTSSYIYAELNNSLQSALSFNKFFME